ncbi:MAG TPA: hypothetical protein VMU28_13115 [Terriglobales bacterium]|nr:hypothetical protein [Terriglobales bacterium]
MANSAASTPPTNLTTTSPSPGSTAGSAPSPTSGTTDSSGSTTATSGSSATGTTSAGTLSAPTTAAAAPPAPTGGVSIATPANGQSIAAPVQFAFSIANAPASFQQMLLEADGTPIFNTGQQNLAGVYVFLEPGPHQMSVVASDNTKAQIGSASIDLTIAPSTSPLSIANIQQLLGWTWCTAALNGGPCASGLGNATTTMMEYQPTPSLSGNSAQFTIGGTTGYSNALWWKSLGGGTPLNHLTFDLEFYIDDATKAEALEFDVNQSYSGTRYTYGTECSYKNTGVWDIWDPSTESWKKTSVPCPPVSSKTWHHLVWQFERVNGQVHYVSVTLDGAQSNVDMLFDPQTNWTAGEDIDIAFQMDGDYAQHPYTVWLDEVMLSGTY